MSGNHRKVRDSRSLLNLVSNNILTAFSFGCKFNQSEARSVQKRLRARFSQYGPELVRVNKQFILWLCLTLLYYLNREPWRIGMKETVYRKAFKTQQFYFTHKKSYIAQEKVKTLKKLSVFI